MMLGAAYLMLALCVACVAWAAALHASVSFSGDMLASAGGMSGARRMAWRFDGSRPGVFALLGLLGRWIPRGGRSADELVYTGVRLTEEQLSGIQVLTALGLAFVFFTLAREVGQVEPLLVVAAGAFGFFLPRLWLRARVQRRQRAIVRMLPEVIDLLSLCIGAGLDFLSALNKVVLVKSFQGEPLIQELGLSLQEIKLGKRRFEALRGLSKRARVAEVSSFVRTLVQADRMGTPISEVLSVHSEDVRFERFMRAERAALKAPIKILLPLIFCIMPCVALIVGAPIILQFMTQSPFGK
jgi:tight adherence protein C